MISINLIYFLKLSIDEVGAIVIDVGSHTTRVGYAGEDMPKVEGQERRRNENNNNNNNSKNLK